MFSILQAIYVFLSVSGPSHELFFRAQVDANLKVFELGRLAETRCCYRYRSMSKVKLWIEIIVNVLETLSLQKIDRLATAES